MRGYLVDIGEVVAPLLILAGIWTRAAALVLVANMIVAVLLVHTAEFFTLSFVGCPRLDEVRSKPH
ncbi:DoxX family protein [Cupriavidus gilardii]|nr:MULTISPECIES: DoxX family protein [Burkholderiales]MCR4143208.1 DoxX family protein [Alcaligenes faecalis]MCT9013843.1 DoxX family protein [Cupriavidus gilardii]MCT9052031.1 DoxX family protein [Cupriavidus gilardii]